MTRILFMLPALVVMGCDTDTKDTTALTDGDGDGFTSDIDCDDGDAAINPAADELCDDVDNNCNEEIDEYPTDGTTYYADGDGDGYGDVDSAVAFCSAPGSGYVENSDDCDDGYALSNPGTSELCDGLDNDCDGTIDNDLKVSYTFYADTDGDGYGDPGNPIEACEAPSGYTTDSQDCDDADASINPDSVWLPDGDGDGYGDDDGYSYTGCEAPERYTNVGGDCNDDDEMAYPGASEQCNGEDDDCDGSVASDEQDVDFDGELACDSDCDDTDASVSSTAEEVCDDGIDNNCNGTIDDACPLYLSASTVDVVVSGRSQYDYFGYSVSAGDINGDGDDDFLVGAYGAEYDTSLSYAGEVYVFEGPLTAGASFSADDADYTLSGTTSSDYFGMRMRADLDLDGDGYEDIVATAYGNDTANSAAGATYVYYGPLTGDMLDEDADAAIYGINSSDYLGYNPFDAGDIDGDGDDDLSVNAYYWDIGTSLYSVGRIGIFDEPMGEMSLTEADVGIIGVNSYSYVGYSIEMDADADGDGVIDLAWGDYGEDKTFITYGPVTDSAISYVDAEVALSGNQTYGSGGLTSGDFNGDGYDDFARASSYQTVGSAYYAGKVHIMYGPFNSDRNADTDYDAEIAGHESYIYLGRSNYGQMESGDLNADGFDELMIGSQYVDANGLYSTGATFVYYGPMSGNYSTSAPDRGYYGAASYDYSGRGVGTGDLDGDGNLDLLLASSGANSYYGEAYVLFDENF